MSYCKNWLENEKNHGINRLYGNVDSTEEKIIEPIQNALYATDRLTTDQCTELADGDVIYNGYNCIVLRIWDGYWYDLQTKENTEKGFIEQFLSVEANELRAQGNVL